MATEARCDTCNAMKPVKQLQYIDFVSMCNDCKKSPKKTTKKKMTLVEAQAAGIIEPDEPMTFSKARCERCHMMRFASNMQVLEDGEHVCNPCLIPQFEWYGVATVGSDNKVRSNIIKAVDKEKLTDKLGRIVIPRKPEERVTKNSYDVFTTDGQIAGQVSAECEEEALHMAKLRFEKVKGGRGVYHPELVTDVYKETVAVKEGSKFIYHALSTTGRIMGIIRDLPLDVRKKKSPAKLKAATEMAIKLYGPKEETNDPRAPVTKFYTVSHVEQIKEGGKKIVQKKKSMPGYLLVQMRIDQDILKTVEKTRGVLSVLPIPDRTIKLSVNDEEGEPEPAPIPEEEMEEVLNEPVLVKPTFKVGELVQVVSGGFDGLTGPILKIHEKKESVDLGMELLGQKTAVEVAMSDLKAVAGTAASAGKAKVAFMSVSNH